MSRIADLATMSNLIDSYYLGYRIDPHRHPKLAAYFEAQLRHPSIRTALAAEQNVAASMGLDQAFARDLLAGAA